MKKLLFALTLSAMATSVQAGSYGKPVMEKEIVIEETVAEAGSDEWAFVMMVFVLFVVAGLGGQ